MRENKKAQMKIQQMAFMLMAIFLFFMLIGVAVLSFKLSSMKETAALLEEKNAFLLVSKLSNSPEFSCGQAFGTTKIYCLDMDKLMTLKQNIEDYAGFWGVENIEVRKIYPNSEEEIPCTNENYPGCNVLKLISESSSGIGVAGFVALCRIEDSKPKCELGKLIINYKLK